MAAVRASSILPAAAAPSAGRRTSAAAPKPPVRAKQAGAHTTSSAIAVARRAQHRPGVYTPRAGPYDAGAELQHVTIRMDELTCIPHCTADGSQLDYNWDADGDD